VFQADPSLRAAFDADPSKFYLLARAVSVTFSLLSLPLVYLVGRQAFAPGVALVGTVLAAFHPVTLAHAQLARTDSAALFFGFLALWLILRLAQRPSLRAQVAAGAAIGLSVATRYFMIALAPVLAVVDLLILSRLARPAAAFRVSLLALGVGLACTVAGVGWYFSGSFKPALAIIAAEVRRTGLGGTDPRGLLHQAVGVLWAAVSPAQLLLVVNGVILFGVGVLLWFRRSAEHPVLRAYTLAAILGLIAMPLTFVLVTPYFVLDFSTAVRDLGIAMRPQIGSDNLSTLGNFAWYLVKALPRAVSWPEAVLAGIGIGLTLTRRPTRPALFLLVYTGAFIGLLSTATLHHQRWLIQVLPVFALFAAVSLEAAACAAARHWPSWVAMAPATLAGLTTVVLILPLRAITAASMRQTRPSTEVLTRSWIYQNLPPGSAIAQEWYTAPLTTENFATVSVKDRLSETLPPTRFKVLQRFSLARERMPEDYARLGYRYLILNSGTEDLFRAEPSRYQPELAFYPALLRQARLLHEVPASPERDGGTIRVYEFNR
jgi:hypothetical protein